MKQPVSRRTEYRQGLLDALPLTISLILFGGIFGMLSIQAGLTSWQSLAMSPNRFRQHKSDATYALAVGLSLYLSWAVGTWIGTIAGQWLPDPAALGLNFSFTAMFLALAYYQLQSVARIATFLFCGAIAVWLGMILPNGLHLLAAGIVAFGIGYFLPQKQENTAREANSTQEVKSV